MITATFFGRLGRDAELKHTPSGSAVLEFSIATSRKVKGEEVTVWMRCSLWGKRGESLAQHLTKGTGLVVTGSLEPREYTTKEGETRTSMDVNVHDITFAGGGGEASGSSPSPRATQGPAPPVHDDDIPF